jgi:hypothetical protein
MICLCVDWKNKGIGHKKNKVSRIVAEHKALFGDK